jgi:L-threonylcarbamoyladenylate synthase
MHISIETACQYLRNGQPVALPTETVYGLAACLHDEVAVKAVFDLKKRPNNNPLIIHIGSWQEMLAYCDGSLPPTAELLARAFWPGPLTLVLPVSGLQIPTAVRAGLTTAAFRMPNHPMALAVIAEVGPIVMPSANLSGKPSTTSPAHVEEDFGRDFPVVDGGLCYAGVESTVLTWVDGHWEILRLGAISAERVGSVLGTIPDYRAVTDETAPLCPGRLYRHYAPQAQLILDGLPPVDAAVIGFSDRTYPAGHPCFFIGPSHDSEAAAAGLYAALRAVDAAGYRKAWVDMHFPNTGLWQTVAERLQRAAA